MDEKYYIPEIEDFRIGYEYEMYEGFGWTKQVFPKPWWFNNGGMGTINVLKNALVDYIHVPYLTKEQIEAEGWKIDHEWGDDVFRATKGVYMIVYSMKSKKIDIHESMADAEWHTSIDSVECRCINDFRWLMKRVEVK